MVLPSPDSSSESVGEEMVKGCILFSFFPLLVAGRTLILIPDDDLTLGVGPSMVRVRRILSWGCYEM